VKDGRPWIEELRGELARSGSVDELERKLMAVALDFYYPVRRKRMVGRRTDLGLYVFSLSMPYQGLAVLGDSEAVVALKRGDSIRRRQALAHECAHGLLRDVDRAALRLTREHEDRLCSRFARYVLMPKPLVKRYLSVHGFPSDLDALKTFCGYFKVSIRAAIAALNEHGGRAGSSVLIAATYRSHEKRPREYDFRVDVAASHPDFFVPRDRRLT